MRLLVLALLTICGQLGAQDKGVPTEVVRTQYAITFPTGWEVGTGWTEEDVYALAPTDHKEETFRDNVNVLVDNEVGGLSLEEYYNVSLNGLRMLATDFELEESGDTKIGGQVAKYLIFTHRAGVYDLKVLQYMILAGGRAYLITTTATISEFDRYEPEFRKIASTFRLA